MPLFKPRKGETQAVEVRTYEPTATVTGTDNWKYRAVVRRPQDEDFGYLRAGRVYDQRTFRSKERAERWASKTLRELVALIQHEEYQKNITVR